MPILFLLFVLVPVAEIALFVQVGGFIGLVPTLIIVIATAALGTWLLRRQGLSTMNRARNRLDAGELPADELVEGLILLVGGVLLLTPGFMTDAFGFACLIPPSRRWLARFISRRVSVATLGQGGGGFTMGAGPGPRPGGDPRSDTRSGRGSGDVIDGEWKEVDRES